MNEFEWSFVDVIYARMQIHHHGNWGHLLFNCKFLRTNVIFWRFDLLNVDDMILLIPCIWWKWMLWHDKLVKFNSKTKKPKDKTVKINNAKTSMERTAVALIYSIPYILVTFSTFSRCNEAVHSHCIQLSNFCY